MNEDARAFSALDAAIAAAGRRSNAIYARWGGDKKDTRTVADIDTRARHHAARWREAGATAGDGVVIVGAPSPGSLAAIVGAHRAGLEVALAPPAYDAESLARAAVAARASIMAGPLEFAGLRIGERLFGAAAASEKVRLVGVHGGDISGALSLDADLEDVPIPTEHPRAPTTHAIDILDDRALTVPIHDAAATALALDFVGRARLNSGDVIVSLLSLGAAPGLIFGALAPLLSGAHLIWQAPFAAAVLAEALECAPRVHLIAPRAVAETFLQARLVDPFRLASLTWATTSHAAPAPRFPGIDPRRVFSVFPDAGGALMLLAAQSETK